MSSSNNRSDWIVRFGATSDPALRLFCFPYAGSGAHVYRSWASALPPSVELCAIQLPGRGRRLQESLYTSMTSLVDTVTRVLAPDLDRPSVVFGHSLGGLTGFAFVRAVRQASGLVTPMHLGVSGHVAPHLPDPNPELHEMSDDELLELLGTYGGTPDEIIGNEEMMEVFLPIVKADLQILESYTYRRETILSCSISAHCGRDDPRVPDRAQLEAWGDHTRGRFECFTYPGGHFYLDGAEQTLVRDLFRAAQPPVLADQMPQ